MSRPHLATLRLTQADKLPSNAVIGIDTQFFTVTNFLKGIKEIPSGLHLLHYSNSVEDGSSVRYGWWLLLKEGDVFDVSWQDEDLHLESCDQLDFAFGNDYQYMVTYPEDVKVWSALTTYTDMEAVEEYVPSQTKAVTTSTPSVEENMVLMEILRSKGSKTQFSEVEEALRYTVIEMKKAPPNTVGQELTQSSLDKSWYLSELFGHDPELLLGELQISYLHFIVLGNLCSYTQWMQLLRLLSRCKSFMNSNENFAKAFTSALAAQLSKLPLDYISGIGNQIVELHDYVEIMDSLGSIFEQNHGWSSIQKINSERFGLQIESQAKHDENSFEVYNLSDHDENDEDAPALVY